jgi:hypothetical protein
LRRDRAFHHLALLLGCGAGCHWAGFPGRAQLRSDRRDGHPQALDPIAEVGRRAQADFLTERLQLPRQCHQRLDIAPASNCR